MERINVSKEWRLAQCNSTFEMKFASEIDMRKAFKAMESAIMGIDKEYYEDYLKEIWLQDLSDCCECNKFEIVSALSYDAFADYIPEMCKAVAKAFPEIEFEGWACYDDLKCYLVDNLDFSYKDGVLHVTEEFKEDEGGYFCPKCGYFFSYCDDVLDDETIICGDCGEIIEDSDLEIGRPQISEFEYKIR